MEVREATPDDVAGIRRVATAAYREAYEPVFGPEGVEALLERWYSSESVADSVERPDSTTFVAAEDGAVVGFASAGAGGGTEGTLGTLYVHPDCWGEGVGTPLFDRCADHLATEGVERMRVHVFAENDVGTGFYADRARRIGTERHEVLDDHVRVAVFVTDL